MNACGWASAEPTRYELIFRLAGVSYVEYEVRTGITRCDASLLQLLGLDPLKPLASDEWLMRVHPGDRQQVLEVSRRAIVERRTVDAPSREYTIRLRAEPGWRWFRTRHALIEGEDARLVTILTDITAEMQQRMAVISSADMYRGVWHSLPGLAVVIDASGTIIDANGAWHQAARVGGGPLDAFVGESYLEVLERSAQAGHAAAEAALAGLRRVLRSRERRFSIEYECCPPNGNARWFRMVVVPLRRAARGALIVHSDITAPRKSEFDLRRERDHMAHLQRLSTMNELATSIAHELNQPLATIVASASTARRLLDPSDDSQLRPVVDDILEAAMRAAKVMRTARSLVRQRQPDRGRVDLNEIINSVIRLLASDVLIHQISLSAALASDCPAIVGDRVQLQQVVMNLLLNAIEAVSVKQMGERHVSIATDRPDASRVRITVSDNGCGVSPTLINRVFEPFITTKHDGTGLGLAIVRAIVEAHGGRISVQCPTEGGAIFCVTLPYEHPEEFDGDVADHDVRSTVPTRDR